MSGKIKKEHKIFGINVFVGDKFGRLIIIEDLGRSPAPSKRKPNGTVQIVKCKCSCGNELDVKFPLLIHNGTKSCGCLFKEMVIARNKSKAIHTTKTLKNKKFGKLTILKIRHKSKTKVADCICDCGNRATVILNNILRDNVCSCGCSRFAEDPWLCDYNCYKKHCVDSRNIKFHLTLDEYKYLCTQNCNYCGKIPTIEMTAGFEKRNGIDRINNNQDYNINNCCTCCFICNKMKLKFDQLVFVQKIYEIYNCTFDGIKNLEQYIYIHNPITSVRVSKNPWATEHSKMVLMAAKRNRNFDLTVNEVKFLCLQNCYYCGQSPSIKMKVKSGGLRNGIDRVDNNQAYLINNCVTCCAICNRIKGTLTQLNFLNKVKEIYNYRINKEK